MVCSVLGSTIKCTLGNYSICIKLAYLWGESFWCREGTMGQCLAKHTHSLSSIISSSMHYPSSSGHIMVLYRLIPLIAALKKLIYSKLPLVPIKLISLKRNLLQGSLAALNKIQSRSRWILLFLDQMKVRERQISWVASDFWWILFATSLTHKQSSKLAVWKLKKVQCMFHPRITKVIDHHNSFELPL